MRAIEVRQLIPKDRINAFHRLQDWRSVLAIASVWGAIAIAAAVAATWPHPLVLLAAFIVIGSRQFGLAVLMHDAAHGSLFRNKDLNDWASQWLCAYPIMSDTKPYRPYHLQHHAFTETEKDPDLVLSRPFPVTKASFARKLLRDITGVAGVRRYYNSLRSTLKNRSGQNRPLHRRLAHAAYRLRGFLLTNALIFAAFALTLGPLWYIALWWGPMLTWYSLIYRLRNIAEHAMVPNRDDLSNTRTTLSSAWWRWIMAPMNVNYHLEHHIFPQVPWYNLPQVHRALLDAGLGEKMYTEPSYFRVFAKVATAG